MSHTISICYSIGLACNTKLLNEGDCGIARGGPMTAHQQPAKKKKQKKNTQPLPTVPVPMEAWQLPPSKYKLASTKYIVPFHILRSALI